MRSSLYPFLSHVRILRFLSSSLSLPLPPLLSVTDMPGGARAHPLSFIRHEGAKHGGMVQEVREPGQGEEVEGVLNLGQAPHPFDRLFRGTPRQAPNSKGICSLFWLDGHQKFILLQIPAKSAAPPHPPQPQCQLTPQMIPSSLSQFASDLLCLPAHTTRQISSPWIENASTHLLIMPPPLSHH